MAEITIEQNDRVISALATGGETSFPYDFPIDTDTELLVEQIDTSDVVTTLGLGTDYTVTGVGAQSGGTIVLDTTAYPSGAPVGNRYIISGDVPEERLSNFQNKAKIPSATLNRELRALTKMVQELRRDMIKSERGPSSDGFLDMVLPQVSARAGKAAGWDGSGQPIALAVPDGSSTLVTPVGRSNSRTLAVQAGLYPFFNVKDPDYGAAGDGVTNDTAAIQAAIDAAEAADGGWVFFPAGDYLINATLTVTENNVRMIGAGGFQTLLNKTDAPDGAVNIIWDSGAAASDMIFVSSPTKIIVAFYLQGIMLDANAVAARCLHLEDVQHWVVEHVMMRRAVTEAWTMDNDAAKSLTGAAGSPGLGFANNIRIDLRGQGTDAAHGIGFDGIDDPFIGQTLSHFQNLRIDHANGHGIRITEGDLMSFDNCFTFRAQAGETGYGVHIAPNLVTTPVGVDFRNQICTWGEFRIETLGAQNIHRVRIAHLGGLFLSGPGRNRAYVTEPDKGRFEGLARQDRDNAWAQITDEMHFNLWDATNKIVHTKQGTWTLLDGVGVGSVQAIAIGSGGCRVRNGSNAGARSSLISADILIRAIMALTTRPYLVVQMTPVDITGVKFRIGFIGADADPPADGYYWEFDPAVNANWRAITRLGGAETATVSSVVGAVTTSLLGIIVESDGIMFLSRPLSTSDWTEEAYHTTNLFSGNTGLVVPQIVNVSGGGNKRMDVHRVAWNYYSNP